MADPTCALCVAGPNCNRPPRTDVQAEKARDKAQRAAERERKARELVRLKAEMEEQHKRCVFVAMVVWWGVAATRAGGTYLGWG